MSGSLPSPRRRRLLQLAGATLVVPPLRARAQGPSGHALLVGNTSYNPNDENLPPARKCIADLEARLQRYGFTTVVLHDAPIAQEFSLPGSGRWQS